MIKKNATISFKNAFRYFFVKSYFIFDLHINQSMEKFPEVEVRIGHIIKVENKDRVLEAA